MKKLWMAEKYPAAAAAMAKSAALPNRLVTP